MLGEYDGRQDGEIAMAWEKIPMDKMEMMHLLGLVYAKTAVGFGKVGLVELIRKEAKKTIRPKRNFIVKAFVRSGLLEPAGLGKAQGYKWNLKEFGPPSLLVAEMMICATEDEVRKKRREYYANVERKTRKRYIEAQAQVLECESKQL